MPSGNKPFPEPVLNQIYAPMTQLGRNELTSKNMC